MGARSYPKLIGDPLFYFCEIFMAPGKIRVPSRESRTPVGPSSYLHPIMKTFQETLTCELSIKCNDAREVI